MSELFEFEVPREKWIRGQYAFAGTCGVSNGTTLNNSTLLRQSDGCRCCLGHLGKALGYTDEELGSRNAPNCVDDPSKFQRFGLVERDNDCKSFMNNTFCSQVMLINDEEDWYDSKIEEQLTKMFAQHGLKPIFTGKGHP